MDVRSRSFLFQLALVQTLSPDARAIFWLLRPKDRPERHDRFERGVLIEDHQAKLMSFSIFIDYTTESIIVTFPGTQTREQVEVYSTLRKTVMPWTEDMSAHKGFLTLYMGIRDALKTSLRSVLDEHSGYGLIFNGWSLGGTMCRFAAWDFLTSPDLYHPFFISLWSRVRPNASDRIMVTSWGAPKCFTQSSAMTYTDRFTPHLEDYRFEVQGDPVTSLPPQWLDFYHVGTRVIVPNWMMDEADGWFKRFQARHFGYAQNTFLMFETLV